LSDLSRKFYPWTHTPIRLTPMSRVLHIAPTPFFAHRGCHVRILEEIRAQQRLGHEIMVLTYHAGEDVPEVHVRRIARFPWFSKLEAGPSMHMTYMDVVLLQKTVRWVKKFRPDIIHGHLHEGGFIGGIAKHFRGVPVVFDAQGSLTGEMKGYGFLDPQSQFYTIMRYLEHRIDNSSQHVIASSGALRDEMVRDFGVDQSRISVVRDGVNCELFCPRHKDRELMDELGIPKDAPVLIYLGGLSSNKGVDLLIEAVARVIEDLPDARFLLMGYPNVEHYRQFARKRGILKNVRFTGQVGYFKAVRYLSIGDVAVAPKLLRTGEANGKIFTYMGCGLPVVCFDFPTNREILGGLGTYATPGDIQGLANGMADLLRDPDKRIMLGRASARRARNHFSWDRVAGDIQKVYDRLLS